LNTAFQTMSCHWYSLYYNDDCYEKACKNNGLKVKSVCFSSQWKITICRVLWLCMMSVESLNVNWLEIAVEMSFKLVILIDISYFVLEW